MRRRALLTLTFTFLLSLAGRAQEPEKVREPEYLAQPHYLDSKTQSLVSLERQMAARKWKSKALGFGGGSGGYELKGGKSPVRFQAGSKMEFVVRVESFKRSPADILQLLTLKEKKDKRELITTKIGPIGTRSTVDPAAGAIAFTAHRYGDSSFKITPSSPLPAGEYAIQMTTVAPGTFFCFGVDPTRQ